MINIIQEKIYSIHTSYATFSVITQRYNTKVIDAPPIANWTIGEDITAVLRYYVRIKHATAQVMHIRYYR